MANTDLRREADALEARIEAARPGRHRTRIWRVGKMVTEGRVLVSVDRLEAIARDLEEAGEEARARSIDIRLLEQHGYGLDVQDGKRFIAGPRGYPGGGPPPAPGSVFGGSEESSSGGTGGGTDSGQGTTGEAWRQVEVTRDFAEWQAEVRKRDVWDLCQEDRIWTFGEAFLRPSVEGWLGLVRAEVASEGDPVEVGLWSGVELRRDYPDWQVAADGTEPAADV